MIELQNGSIRVGLAPEVGARIVHFVDMRSGYDFLWRNSALPLRRELPGAEYDPNFYGGIDELIPNDFPETIAGSDCPDHGEMWTSEFRIEAFDESSASLNTYLPVIEFEVSRTVRLVGQACEVTTKIRNRGTKPKPFLWKLHAALAIQPGDVIQCPATNYSIAASDWSRRSSDGNWAGETVPAFDGTTEFLYLHGLGEGAISWRRGAKRFEVEFDLRVFPYAWYFASYGGFQGHHVAILEPCNCMPISVNEAVNLGQCPILEPGQSLETTYVYRGTVDED